MGILRLGQNQRFVSLAHVLKFHKSPLKKNNDFHYSRSIRSKYRGLTVPTVYDDLSCFDKLKEEQQASSGPCGRRPQAHSGHSHPQQPTKPPTP